MAPRKCVGDFSTNLGMPNQNPGLNSKAAIRVKAAQEFLKWSNFYPTLNGRNPAPPWDVQNLVTKWDKLAIN